MSEHEVNVEIIPIQGSPLSIKTIKQGRVKSISETLSSVEVVVGSVTISFDPRMGAAVGDKARSTGRSSIKRALRKGFYDTSILERNCKRIINFKFSTSKQKEVAQRFLSGEEWYRNNNFTLIY